MDVDEYTNFVRDQVRYMRVNDGIERGMQQAVF